AGAQGRVRAHPEPAGQLVGGLEADPPDVGGEAVGVGADHVHGLVAVGAVDAHGAGGAQAVRLPKDHDVAHRLLLAPAVADLLDSARADALDLLEVRRAFVDDLQRALAEDLHDLAGVDGADPFHQTGREILLDPLHGRWRGAAHLFGLELLAVLRVVIP